MKTANIIRLADTVQTHSRCFCSKFGHNCKTFETSVGEGGGCWSIYIFMKWKRVSTRLFMYNVQSLVLLFIFFWALLRKVGDTLFFMASLRKKLQLEQHIGPILKYSIRPKDSKNAIIFFYLSVHHLGFFDDVTSPLFPTSP